MGCCPQCGGINTLDNIDGKALACRECGWTRRRGLDRWLPAGRFPPAPGGGLSLPLLPSLLRTTPGEDEGRAEPVYPPWTRDPAEHGGPRTGGPTTPARPEPLPAGIPRRRKPLAVEPAVALPLILALALLPCSSASPVSPALDVRPCDGPNFQVSLALLNSTRNVSTPVSSALIDLFFVNNSSAEPIENFSVSNGGSYAISDFSGLNLTNVTNVIVGASNLTGFPNSTLPLVEVDNLTSSSNVTLDLVWVNETTGFVPIWSNGTFVVPPPPFPLFLQLVGVGLFLAFSFLVVLGLSRVVSAGPEDDP